MPEGPLGFLAEFTTADELVAAARRTWEVGYRCIDTFTPYPIDQIPELLRIRSHTIGWLSIIGGLFGFVGAFVVQSLTNFDYAIDVGGRPLIAVPAFFVVDFELMVLFAVLFPVVGMLRLNGLPRLHHPLFANPRFGLATDDRFFLYIDSADPRFDRDEVASFLQSLSAASVQPVRP